MGKIKRFEDIGAWQKARMLVNKIYSITSDGLFTKDLALKDQIRRASISVMLNIAEGFARKTKKEFAKFLYIAHGSVAEVQSSLYIALDLKYISNEQFSSLYSDCEEISKMISGLIKYLEDKQ
jgi:four helix bundle protein